MKHTKYYDIKIKINSNLFRRAEQHAASSRKMKLILSTVGIVVLLIVILVILSEFGAFSSR